jgi:hypothetical protein
MTVTTRGERWSRLTVHVVSLLRLLADDVSGGAAGSVVLVVEPDGCGECEPRPRKK